MKNAIGSAMRMSTIVTSSATPTVRRVTVWYSEPVSTVMMLSRVQVWEMTPVNESTVHSAVMSSAASAAM
jgi:hypothetical protein